MRTKLTLPAMVYEKGLSSYISYLLSFSDYNQICLDFKRVKFFTPGAVVGTLAVLYAWYSWGKQVFVRNHGTNPACGYLQRIDFFKQIGLELPEPGRRQEEAGRFMPIEMINFGQGDAARIGSRMAECVSPGGFLCNEAYQLAQYACAEIVTNCKQHSNGVGFVSAQYTRTRDFARVAIADHGIGILESFKQNRSPHFRPGMSDIEAIRKALEPLVSSKTHLTTNVYGSPSNKGVGLSMIQHLMAQSQGYMIMISGNAWFFKDGILPAQEGQFSRREFYPGTFCAVTFKRGEVINYGQMLHQARADLGLTGSPLPGNLFL
jgi:hypothetical protein